MLRLRLLLLLSLLSASTLGCFSYATMHTAESIEGGTSEVSFGGGVLGGLNGVDGEDRMDNSRIGHLGARHGLNDRLDLGLRLNGMGLVADLNVALVESAHFAFSLDPEVAMVFQKTPYKGTLQTPRAAHHLAGNLNILADIVKTKFVDVTLGISPGYMYATDTNFVGRTGPTLGGGLGLRWEIPTGDSPFMKPILTPAIDVMFPLNEEDLARPTFGYTAIFGLTARL